MYKGIISHNSQKVEFEEEKNECAAIIRGKSTAQCPQKVEFEEEKNECAAIIRGKSTAQCQKSLYQ